MYIKSHLNILIQIQQPKIKETNIMTHDKGLTRRYVQKELTCKIIKKISQI